MPVKKMRTAFIILCLLLSTLAAATEKGYRLTVIESSDAHMICRVAFDDAVISQKKVDGFWYTEIDLPGFAFTDEYDLPRLPAAAIVFGIPAGATPHLSISSEKSTTKSVGDILPVLPVVASGEDDLPVVKTLADPTEWYPKNIARIGVTGIIREQNICQAELFPVRHLQVSGLTQFVQEIEFRIDFHSPDVGGTSAATTKTGDDAFEQLYQKSLVNYDQAKSWRRSGAAYPTIQFAAAATSGNQYKLLLQNDGVYAVTGKELAEAGAVLSSIDPGTLSLTNKGAAVPIIVEGETDGRFDEQDRIIFVGEHNRGDETWFSLFTETNVYWLSWGNTTGSRYVEIPGVVDLSADTLRYAMEKRHIEYDNIYERIIGVGKAQPDHWFWQHLDAPDDYRFALPVSEFEPQSEFHLRMKLQGITRVAASPDHHLELLLNGQKIGDALWNDQQDYTFVSPPLSSDLLSEDNFLSVRMPLDLTDVPFDKVALNWIEVDYRRALQAENGYLEFYLDSSEPQNLKITSFSSPDIYLLTGSGQRIVHFDVQKKDGRYEALFANQKIGAGRYMAVEGSRLSRVEEIVADRPSDLRSKTNSADYIIITHSDFLRQAEQLADYRAGSGRKTIVVDVQDVYDEFSYGIYDPRAIKAFLSYAYENWNPPRLLYVLLFGDTTHNMDKAVARQHNFKSFVPTMMEYTSTWGMTASDNYFAAIVGDDPLPDLFIGRFPVDTVEEADIMVQKTIEYETRQLAEEWRRHVCLLTGNNTFFEDGAQHLFDHIIPRRIVTDRVSTLLESPYFGSTEQVAALINDGQSILNFVGHGGGGVFFDSELFLVEDIGLLHNKGRYPITFSLTCFIGHFDNPDMPSLSEELLKVGDAGIVAHFGSSGRAFLYGDYFVDNALFETIFSNRLQSLAEAVTTAKYDMISKTNSYWDNIKIYTLTGDPALRIRLPEDRIELSLPQATLSEGDTLRLSGTIQGGGKGTLLLAVANEKDSILVAKTMDVNNGSFQADLLTLNPGMRQTFGKAGGSGFIRAYFTDGQKSAASSAVFYINRPIVTAVQTEPEHPGHKQPIFFTVTFDTKSMETFGGIRGVRIDWSANNADWTSVTAIKTAETTWKTSDPVSNIEGTTIFYRVFVTNLAGETVEAALGAFIILQRPDLLIDGKSMVLGGKEQATISLAVRNEGDMDSAPFKLFVYEGDFPQDAVEVANLSVGDGLAADQETTVSLLWQNASSGTKSLTLKIDPDNEVDESNENNNLVQKQVNFVRAIEGIGYLSLATAPGYRLGIPANSLSENSGIVLTREWSETLIAAARQSSLTPIPTQGVSTPAAMGFRLENDNARAITPFEIKAVIDPADTLVKKYLAGDYLKLYALNEQSNTWIGQESSMNKEAHTISAKLPLPFSTFSLFATLDNEAPDIDISIEGQHFADGDIVSQSPAFTIFLSDQSGFDLDVSPVKILLDGQTMDKDEYSLYREPGTKNKVSITFIPTLAKGDHTLQVEAIDVNGNVGRSDVRMSVSGEFTLLFIANHPNPFADRTVIAFNLTDMAEEVKLGVYTVSGYLIRSFSFYDIGGYMEQDWDGADEDGDQVANGVYYLKFVAKSHGKKIERIEKMARLQ